MTSGKSPIKNKPYWVKASWVMKVTGWNREEMRRARVQNMITWRHTDIDGFQYDLNSVHPLLIKKPLAAETTNG